jgi:tetratricopeptide (TPR) repeat protein
MQSNKTATQLRNVGNEFYKQRKFYEALIWYNKSLCHCELGNPNSLDMALTYSNRSVVYLELCLFDKCLENVELARSYKYPHEPKLKERAKKCKNLKKKSSSDPENDPENFFKLSYLANEKIPSIVNCLGIRQNAQFGRHVITNRDLNPGDVIAVEEMCFKSIGHHARYNRCFHCLKSNMLSLIPCDGYCNFGELIKHSIVPLNLSIMSILFSDVLQHNMHGRRTKTSQI